MRFGNTSLGGVYIVIICSIATIVATAGAYLFSRHGFSIERLVTNVLVPFAPAILWFLRELVDQSDVRRRNQTSRGTLKPRGAVSQQGGPEAEAAAGEEADYLQSVLFAYRRSDVSVPGWLYDLTRNWLHADVDDHHSGDHYYYGERVERDRVTEHLDIITLGCFQAESLPEHS